MAFKIPEDRRLTSKNVKQWEYISKEILDLATESSHGQDGFFFIPAVNTTGTAFRKSAKFLCRTTVAEGWRMVAITIPAERRSPTLEEVHWVKKFFFNEIDITISVQPGKQTYCFDHPFYVFIWQPVDGWERNVLPPIFKTYPGFRKVSMFTRLKRIVVNRLREEWMIRKAIKKPVATKASAGPTKKAPPSDPLNAVPPIH